MVVRVVREEVKVGFLAKLAAKLKKRFTAMAGSGALVPDHVANESKAVVAVAPAHDYEIGQLVKDKGIYVGIWRPVDREGHKLNTEFNVFAAPEDTQYLTSKKPKYTRYFRHLTNTTSDKLATYNDDLTRIAGLRGICGHDGVMLVNDSAIYDAVRTGNHAALAKWHMPVKELVHGRNIDGEDVQPDNLYAHKDKGALKGTFTDKAGSVRAHWYRTASELRFHPSRVYSVLFTVDDASIDSKDHYFLSSRPVRAEPRPAA